MWVGARCRQDPPLAAACLCGSECNQPVLVGRGVAFAYKKMLRRVINDVFMNSDFFAEEVTFYLVDPGTSYEDPVSSPVAGDACPVTVHIDSDRDREFVESGALRVVERLLVLVSRVEDEEENTKGWFRTPAVGMKMMRSVEADPWQEPFVFTGEISYERATHWRLVFERERTLGQGMTR